MVSCSFSIPDHLLQLFYAHPYCNLKILAVMRTGHCDIWMLLLNLWSTHFWLLDWHLVSASFFKFPLLHWIFLSWLLNICHVFDLCWRADPSNDLFSSSGQLQYLYCWLCSWLAQWDKIVFFYHMRSWNWFVEASTIVCMVGRVC